MEESPGQGEGQRYGVGPLAVVGGDELAEWQREVEVGDALRLGRYGFVVSELAPEGRKDARLVLRYDRVPSLLGLKTILPGYLQRALRFRRSRQRAVS